MKSSVVALLGGASTALAAVKGFNYASQGNNQAAFEGQFKMAASLPGGFNSARLYTMIQDGTTNTPSSALQAAIDTKTTLLLGLWASQDQDGFNNELAALTSAISTYGSSLASLVQGISVGSEDLYRQSPTGLANDPTGVGQSPDVLVTYIGQVRDAIKGTTLSQAPVGHVDTWNVYVNSSVSNVIDAADFLGLDEYPYYQTTDPNAIGNNSYLFFQAYDRVQNVARGKPIWVTESGYPVSGPTSGQAVPSVSNAQTYWQEVACELEKRNIDFWWYILQDAGASPSFGVSNNGQALYDLTCNATSGYDGFSSSSGSSTTTGSGSASGTGAVGTGTGGAGGTSTGTALSTPYASKTPSVVSSGGSNTGSGTSPTSTTNAASMVRGSLTALVVVAAVAMFAL